MNWFEQLEQKRTLLIGGVVIICVAILAVTARRNNVSLDSFWHLQMGLDWLASGLSLWRDHYSFTFNGEDIVGPPYIFEILIGALVNHFGLESGFQLYKLCAGLLTLGLAGLFFRRLRSPVAVWCLALPLIVVLLQFRAMVRPELISYSFSVLAIMLYYRARNGMGAANMLPMVALMLLWSNYHSSIFGYVIFLGYFIDAALLQYRKRAQLNTWLQWLGWGVAVVAVGFLNPGFHHTLIDLLNFSPGWKHLIREYQSAFLYREIAAVYALVTVTGFTVFTLLRQRQFGLLFVCTFLVYFSLDMVRLVTPAGIVVVCIFAWVASESDLENRLKRLPSGLNLTFGGVTMLLLAMTMGSSVLLARSFMVENQTSGNLFPDDVADYMIEQDISGRIFNEYDVGGYLIYRLSPASQVYIDGRTNILYPLEFFIHAGEAERSSALMRAEADRYDIDLVLLRNKLRNFSMLKDTGTFGLDYVGSRYSLFRRTDPNFPALGTLLAYPACWRADMATALREEHTRALLFLPPNSALPALLQLVIDYTGAQDKTRFLQSLQSRQRWTLETARFIAYRALAENLDAMAYGLLTSITEREFSDYLGAALAQTRLENWSEAERLLDQGTRVSWSENPSEISILYGLLSQIQARVSLRYFDDAYIARLAEQAENGNADPGVGVRSFCPDAQIL